jgi:type IV pilus assembly protein PilO
MIAMAGMNIKLTKEQQQMVVQTDREIQNAEAQARRLPQLKAQIAELEEKAIAAEKRLPKTRNIPALLDTLSELSQQHRVEILTFSPGGEAVKNNIVELSYPMSIKGDYHSVAKFLASLALQERIFHARNLTLTPLGGDSGLYTVSGQFTLVAFQYRG